jgi:hypothetical protein
LRRAIVTTVPDATTGLTPLQEGALRRTGFAVVSVNVCLRAAIARGLAVIVTLASFSCGRQLVGAGAAHDAGSLMVSLRAQAGVASGGIEALELGGSRPG